MPMMVFGRTDYVGSAEHTGLQKEYAMKRYLSLLAVMAVVFLTGCYQDEIDNISKYVTVTNDLDTVGRWSLQSYVETPLGKWYGTVKAFQVQGNI